MADGSNQDAQARLAVYRKDILGMTLMDDLMFQAAMDNSRECMGEILKVVMKDGSIRVRSVQIQRTFPNSQGRSAVFDVVAVDGAGKVYGVEVQRLSAGASFWRVRYR